MKLKVFALVTLLGLSAGVYAMRPEGETRCTGAYYLVFDELVDHTCIVYDEEGFPQNGQRVICTAALFANCYYDNCCK